MAWVAKQSVEDYTVRVWQIEATEAKPGASAGADREGYGVELAGQFVARITDAAGQAYDEDGIDYNLWIAPYASLHTSAEAALAEGVAAVKDGVIALANAD